MSALMVATLSNAQELKTYSGSFKNGEATYTYYETDEGRVFQGEFHWKGNGARPGYMEYKGEVEIRGSFKNNKRDGLWTYTATNKLNEVNTLKANYVDGVPDGIYEYEENWGMFNEKIILSATNKNGRVNGPVKIELPNSVITGEYTKDTRTGVWERKFKNGSYYHIVCKGSQLYEGYDIHLEDEYEGNFVYDIEDGSKKKATEYDMLRGGSGTVDKDIFEAACWNLERIHCIGDKGIVIPQEEEPAQTESTQIPKGNSSVSQQNSQGTSAPALTREEAILRYRQNNAKTESEKLRENLERLGVRRKK